MDNGFRRLLPPIDSREGKEGKGRLKYSFVTYRWLMTRLLRRWASTYGNVCSEIPYKCEIVKLRNIRLQYSDDVITIFNFQFSLLSVRHSFGSRWVHNDTTTHDMLKLTVVTEDEIRSVGKSWRGLWIPFTVAYWTATHWIGTEITAQRRSTVGNVQRTVCWRYVGHRRHRNMWVEMYTFLYNSHVLPFGGRIWSRKQHSRTSQRSRQFTTACWYCNC